MSFREIQEMIDKADKREDFDIASKIIDFENGDLDEDQTIELFQELLDSGMVWQLQGFYGRMAQQYIELGLIQEDH